MGTFKEKIINNPDYRRKNKQRYFVERDYWIIFGSFCLCLIFFAFDLMVPWAIGSILYVPAILLALCSDRFRQTVIFLAAVTTVLTVVGLMWHLPQEHSLRIMTNHLLAVLIVWTTAAVGILFRHSQGMKTYLAAIVGSSEDAIIGKNLDGIVTSWNTGAQRMFGYKAQEIVGMSIFLIIPEEKIAEEKNFITNIREGRRVDQFETTRKCKDGRIIDVSLTLSSIISPSGRIVGISSITKDISRRIEVEKAVRALHQDVQAEKAKLEEILNVEEQSNRIVKADRLADFIVEKTAAILGAERCSLMFYDDKARMLCVKGQKGLPEQFNAIPIDIFSRQHVSGAVARDRSPFLVQDVETDPRFGRLNYETYRNRSFVSVPIMLGEQFMGVLNIAEKERGQDKEFTPLDLKLLSMIARQVAVALENAKLYRELKYLSIVDPVTETNNFRYFSKSLDYEISRVTRYPGELSLLFLDINNFCSYNDKHGRQEGDAVLRQIAIIIKQNMREVDIACRYAGDAFAVILPGVAKREGKKVADKLCQIIEACAFLSPLRVKCGVASFSPGMNKYDFIQRADLALKQSKEEIVAP